MKIKLGVIFGGVSVEHEVSIISAVQAMNSMDQEKYEIIPIYIDKERNWYTGKMLLDIEIYKDFNDLKKYATKVTMYKKDENGKKTLDFSLDVIELEEHSITMNNNKAIDTKTGNIYNITNATGKTYNFGEFRHL